MKLEFSRQTFQRKKNSNIKFNENPFREAELLHADRRTDRHDEAKNRSSLLFKRTTIHFLLEMTGKSNRFRSPSSDPFYCI